MPQQHDFDEISDRPFIAPERRKIRYRMRTYDRVEWLLRQLRIWMAWLLGVPAGLVAFQKLWQNSGDIVTWLTRHIV